MGDNSKRIDKKVRKSVIDIDMSVDKIRIIKKRPFWIKKKLLAVIICAILAVVVLALGYLLISKLTNSVKDDSTTGKVLTLNDLENPDVELSPNTSNASVENLTEGLKARIDKQIVAKENPIETVKELVGVLSNTTNEKRQDQLDDFLEDFLANHEGALWFESEHNTPDQAQVNYWKAELYAYLIHYYQILMDNKFTATDSKPIDTTKEQLKYIDLYLALANDPISHPPVSEEYEDVLIGYVYREANDFSELKNRIKGGDGSE